jgi:hypothetical protein
MFNAEYVMPASNVLAFRPTDVLRDRFSDGTASSLKFVGLN